MNMLLGLNPAQEEAVKCNDRHLLILAGAGSGKTRVITSKIAWLIAHEKTSPHSILAVTFTNKAAREMRDRAISLEPQCEHAQIRTFHSFGAWFLRQHSALAGLSPNFVIYDDDDSISLIQSMFPGLKGKKAQELARVIARAKDFALSPESPGLGRMERQFEDFSRYYAEYERRLRETGNVDFGGLILEPLRVLLSNPEVQNRIQQRFAYILVDEYQDSNIAQFQLLKALAGSETRICVVGDDDQSIYRFRGAEVNNILDFPNIFPGTGIIRLEQNYRSYQAILDVAQEVVSNNEHRMGKKLVAVKEGGKKPSLACLENDIAEAEYCASIIDREIKNGRRYADFAILYRTNAQSRIFEQVFTQQFIPYRVVGALRFFEREEVKDALAYASLLMNPNDIVACKRIINKPARGIGEATFGKILEQSVRDSVSVLDACREFSLGTARAMLGIEGFLGIIASLGKALAEADTLGDFFKALVAKTGLDDYYMLKEDSDKAENLAELSAASRTYPASSQGLLQFIEYSILDKTQAQSENGDYATLITTHNTKGLEFPVVFLTGLEQGLFPRHDKTGEDLEEERRLFYVAVTRAKEELFMSYRNTVYLHGYIQSLEPSVFLREIPPGLLGISPSSRVNPADSDWKRGMKVYHDDFGTGWVKQVMHEAANTAVVVRFEAGYEKVFLPKYTKALTRIKDSE